jgi:hypothetical protein
VISAGLFDVAVLEIGEHERGAGDAAELATAGRSRALAVGKQVGLGGQDVREQPGAEVTGIIPAGE